MLRARLRPVGTEAARDRRCGPRATRRIVAAAPGRRCPARETGPGWQAGRRERAAAGTALRGAAPRQSRRGHRARAISWGPRSVLRGRVGQREEGHKNPGRERPGCVARVVLPGAPTSPIGERGSAGGGGAPRGGVHATLKPGKSKAQLSFFPFAGRQSPPLTPAPSPETSAVAARSSPARTHTPAGSASPRSRRGRRATSRSGARG